MKGQTVRLFLRWVHILGVLLIGAALYSPLKSNDLFMDLTLYILVPIVAISGVSMWQQGKLMKLLNQNKQTTSREAN
ncbi:hypothetical protein [Aliivibrio fischeri]|uniref:hypothetical protein n=1 Tax=Aliivibrio fischeri TaxID=668 RepID=UPI003735FA6D